MDRVGTHHAARTLGCSVRIMRALIAEGRIRGAYKEGDRWLVPKWALEEFKAKHPKRITGRVNAAKKYDRCIVQKEVMCRDLTQSCTSCSARVEASQDAPVVLCSGMNLSERC